MRLLVKPVAVALLALLVGTPTSASASKRQKTDFSIVIKAVARLEQFPTLPPDLEIDFSASGALKDSGPVGSYSSGYSLWGKHATYVVFFTDEDSFELWRPTDVAWPGELVGAGTYTFESSTKGWWLRQRWELDGTLIGG